ncbi:MAG: prepilin-type N-terminal cleavage/methylation domain-containing protein [Candidatus Absconditabacterales bacterium]|nr:prepilin-type N-terminal cleavage/methylation domain-containing protein [Candidatus Absconditabacterales bacterium]
MKKKYAFTFIEVMIAIVIFSVGILAVLNLLTNNLKSMDRNNLKLQASLLAKEGIELVYNLRDSNIEKGLSWNCLMNDEMYTWDSEKLSDKIRRDNQTEIEDIVCKGYFSIESGLKIGFDPQNYLYSENFQISNDFIVNLTEAKLFFFSDNTGLSRYAYSSNNTGVETNFARYILFKAVKENNETLAIDKILKVESHVLYKKGAYTGELVFESFIGNY